MDRSVDPGTDFYHYAACELAQAKPHSSGQLRWGGFIELQERNWFLLHQILDAATNSPHVHLIVQRR